MYLSQNGALLVTGMTEHIYTECQAKRIQKDMFNLYNRGSSIFIASTGGIHAANRYLGRCPHMKLTTSRPMPRLMHCRSLGKEKSITEVPENFIQLHHFVVPCSNGSRTLNPCQSFRLYKPTY